MLFESPRAHKKVFRLEGFFVFREMSHLHLRTVQVLRGRSCIFARQLHRTAFGPVQVNNLQLDEEIASAEVRRFTTTCVAVLLVFVQLIFFIKS
jgi:hypothetical protein